jgi:pilus assembly protein CpaB
MRMKSLILIFIALGCGLVASIGISQVMDRGGGGGNVEMDRVLVALADIDIGSRLSDKNVKLEDWPKNKVPEGAVRRRKTSRTSLPAAAFTRASRCTSGKSPTIRTPSR